MAKSSKTPPKTDNLTAFPAPESSIALEETPEPRDTSAETPEPATQPSQAPPKGPGRPKKTDESPQSDFFQQVASVRPSDWGTRIYLYLYQLEPVCDLKKSGGKAYLMRYEEPITDEHRIMIEQGSGRYRFILAKNKVSADASNELARYEFEIYNRLYPPKLNREAWVPDPRNRRWEVLLPKEPPPPPPAAAAETVLEGIRLGNELRKEAREELKAETPPAATTPAAAPVDPWAAAERILNMRSENPMVEVLRDELKAMREEMKESRKEAREREFQLQQELRKAQTVTAAPQKGLVEQVVELAGQIDKLEPVKKLFGFGGPAADVATRTARTTPLDVARDLSRDFFASDLSRDLGRWLGSLAERNYQQNPAPNGNGNATQTVARQPNVDPFSKFIEEIVNPKMMMYFNDEPTKDGGDAFADWIWSGFPEFFDQLQNFEHPRLPGMKGAAAIITGYKNTPHIWNQIGPTREVQFVEFVNGFCEWKKPADEPAEDAEVINPNAPIDFDAEETRPS